jgi:hypothetical protein
VHSENRKSIRGSSIVSNVYRVIQITKNHFQQTNPIMVNLEHTNSNASTWNEIVGPPRRTSIGRGDRMTALAALARE